MYSVRTDLAIEAREIYREGAQIEDEVPGVEAQEEGDDEMRVTRVKISSPEGEKAMNKKMGSYITIEIPSLKENNPEIVEKATHLLKQELSMLLGGRENKTALIAGLGNSKITPDSIGPKVVSSLVVTRHLFSNMPEEFCAGLAPVCAIAPGVLGVTGIETGEIIRAVAQNVKPDFIIAVDALASRRMDRVSTTIQIADTGISPGSGVGNKRQELSEETLGVPVIAIGVPMVVDAATIANDTIDCVIDALIELSDTDKEFYKILKDIDREQKHTLIQSVLSDSPLMVTPKEIDAISERVSKILANGINLALHKDITMEEINGFVS